MKHRFFEDWVVTNPFGGRERRQSAEDNPRRKRIKKRWEHFEEWCGKKINHMTPPGFEWMLVVNWSVVGIISCSLISTFGFLSRYGHGWRSLLVSEEVTDTTGRYWNEYKWVGTLPSFSGMMESIMVPFVYLMVIILLLAILHYLYFYHESKSIYLMKRLPKRGEIHRRSLALPLMLIGTCVVTVLLLTIIYFGIYHLFVPARCIAPGQLERFLREGIFTMWRGD